MAFVGSVVVRRLAIRPASRCQLCLTSQLPNLVGASAARTPLVTVKVDCYRMQCHRQFSSFATSFLPRTRRQQRQIFNAVVTFGVLSSTGLGLYYWQQKRKADKLEKAKNQTVASIIDASIVPEIAPSRVVY